MSLGVEPTTIIQKCFEWIGNGFSIAYFWTPLIQIISMYRGTLRPESLPLFLLITILFNCLFWLIYAIKSKELWISMWITNSIGLAVNIVILFLFLYLYWEKKILKFIGYGFFVINLLVEVWYIMWTYVIKDSNELYIVGFSAMTINVIMYASPTQNIFKLFKTGKYEFLPIWTNIIGFYTTLIWFWYGVLTRDFNTMVSNGVSFAVVSLQIGFWIYFFIKALKQQKLADKDREKDNEEIMKLDAEYFKRKDSNINDYDERVKI